MSCRRSNPSLVTAARAHLKRNGWSYRSAARELDRCYQHVSDVLNSRRQSEDLLTRILSLPSRDKR